MGLFNKKEEFCPICNHQLGLKHGQLKCNLKNGVICVTCSNKIKTLEYKLLTVNEAMGLIEHTILCNSCGEQITKKFKKEENKFYCISCLDKAKLELKQLSKEKKENKKNLVLKQKAEAKQLSREKKEIEKEENRKRVELLWEKEKQIKASATIKVGKYLYISDTMQEICIPATFIDSLKILKYTDILDFELLEDGNTISSGGVGRAVAGGFLFGGVGAVVGAATGKHKSTGVVNSMKIKITTKDLNEPVIFIKIFKGEQKKGSFMYNSYQKDAHKILSMLQIIVDKVNQDSTNNNSIIQENQKSKVDELKELKELLDSGILTQEEFNSEKAKILNR
ncbi:SHOCT domain-containing protein [uncultured Clostridium sp.]|uniref:SHOCT domain-containing protein n=1 Tax=uncultured Clostridium sp. TaxID=59620 RepID=UPI0026288410|nr:SHOCT domain-containing protein [uncultured Clostridium sp.]